ncbi:glycosyltransferase family 32 protein [Treponema bryantii]|uniref:glycosyltransferase family 32 protein n=1 Tax=Treponema bryantii TaxID=163 RepID=UPI0003B49BCB|nr:glycosyltransferase [Treponema bryantii]
MIPKIIHYCWFGGNSLPELAQKCIASWKVFLPDYEIKEWNENNYDVHKIPYISQAYNAKKYAFVSDYARFDILYQYGGIYFDTDVEVIKSLDKVLSEGAFAGLESPGKIATGLGIASPAGLEIYKEILESYEKSEFIYKNGVMNLTTVVDRVTGIFKRHGFTDNDSIQKFKDVTIYPAEYFCPLDPKTGILKITDKSLTIHHYAATWTIPLRKKYMTLRTKFASKVGIKFAKILLLPMQAICIIKEVGLKSFLKKI